MAAALPRPVQLRLEQALGQWRHWPLPGGPAAPEIEGPLGKGLSNYSLLVRAGEHRLVLRLDRLDPLQHSLSRPAEWRALQQASRAGLAPTPRWQQPELGALLCDYLPPAPISAAAEIDAIAGLLRGIHALPGVHLRLDLALRLRRYAQQARSASPARRAALEGMEDSVHQQLATASEAAGPPRLCHNDLLRANRLFSEGRLYALDWEYAAMGPVWFDLAGLLAGDDWPPERAAELLRAWLGRPPSAAETLTLARYQVVYRYLELLWLCQPGVDCPETDWDTRRQRLITALAALT